MKNFSKNKTFVLHKNKLYLYSFNMKVLGIETSGLVGNIAVCDGNTVVGKKTYGKGFSHGKEIVSSIESIFDEIRWEPNDIDLIAVSIGPGSYTGLRIAVTCAKTLAYGLGKPVIDVPTLDVLVENVKDNNAKTICPVIDAKRKSVYACIYDRDKNRKITDYLIISPDNLIDMLPETTLIFGDGIAPYKQIFAQKELTILSDEKLGIADAADVARLGMERYEQGIRCEINSLIPLYLRKSEAEERLMESR
ncbi:MAG: tRNA (adenosine(37)-N6)-threonylcarbamoyltransferase complex dimerization subunit type 1 TsaB [Candidatus Scalindua sp.]|nr:tRNA (adenosine(37)-N6)-threonylcarbamoyltransferase complex dimerization subunit type 1 TsaB [Candidatus Scalindua sp.]MBT6048342.1 tRNA (adenosine(37)-N6)-threonylcarbamoyltransferase complex dimerization subunit type 1 TsaB [Candidatus Scalindua sp.]MBT7593204.1 tRNA (adenosine(37)-N6)-threonylcarbamoyltransferase complex dimerization subunit type 1 TsaB [Candidatus Scalindua sp.]